MLQKLQKDVVCFGEILWDVLPNGAKPGGAPMNVAYHLKKLGIDPLLITRVGLDDYGRKLIDMLGEVGIDPEYFQVDNKEATGVVYAKPNEDNEVVYDIVYPAAWDFIELEEEVKDIVATSQYFVYGSLIARNKLSRDTLFQLLEIANKKILDINLRAPFYNKHTIAHLLSQANIAKLNVAELEQITGWFGTSKTTSQRILLLQQEFNIETIIVTKGADGAVIYSDGKLFDHPGFKVDVADTIGSGDAFLAAFIHSLVNQYSMDDAILSASQLGAYVATQTGACPDYSVENVTSFLNHTLKQTSKFSF